MKKKTRIYIILFIIVIILYYLIDRSTTELFNVNKYNKYIVDEGSPSSAKDVACNFISLMINNKFEEAYKLLDDDTKKTFKSYTELKKYFNDNYSKVNNSVNGIRAYEKYSSVGSDCNTYKFVMSSRRYEVIKDGVPYVEGEFVIFDSITMFERAPTDYTINIQKGESYE